MTPDSKPTDTQQREALVSMTALHFIEEHALLRADQLEDAQKSLQALFLRTSGEETMLRKLIEILKTTKLIHQSFASISSILTGITRSVQTVDDKVAAYKQAMAVMSLSAEENADFAGPFLSFSQAFVQKIEAFDKNLRHYVELREAESRYTSIHRIAQEARERLKQRLAGVLGSRHDNETESKIRQNVVASFDFNEAESNLQYAQRETRHQGEEIKAQLEDIRQMCQMAKNPAMRDKMDEISAILKPKDNYPDVFTLFAQALRKHPRLLPIKDIVLELFKLYQHSYGMLRLDCNNLDKAIATMFDNSLAYFEAKEEDKDIQTKREKLKMIEGLIPFLERAAVALMEGAADPYPKFSRRFSELISEKKTAWSHVVEPLLRAKVLAEAELSTRL